MPQKNSRSDPPEVMTWPRATPVLVIAVIFDALRFMFEWFIIFGPAIAAAICTIKLGGTLGTTAAGYVCTGVAGVAGAFGVELTGPFGIVMAEVTGLAGWLVLGLILVLFNERIFKENALWFGGSLLLSEIPFLGSLPFFTATLLKMYSTQITVEQARLKKWESSQDAERRREQERQLVEQSQAAQQMPAEQQAEFNNEWDSELAQQEDEEVQTQQEEVAQQEAANDALYDPAANDEKYIQEPVRKRA